MTFKVGDAVKIRLANGTDIDAHLQSEILWADEPMWWVEYFPNGAREVTVVNEKDLIMWNRIGFPCECGTHAPMGQHHSAWCRMFYPEFK